MAKIGAIIFCMGNQRARRLPSISEGLTLQTKEERRAANDYISGFFLVLYFHCCPCRSDLSDSQGKKIAATTRNSDGCIKMQFVIRGQPLLQFPFSTSQHITVKISTGFDRERGIGLEESNWNHAIFYFSVLASAIVYYICKWLDGDEQSVA